MITILARRDTPVTTCFFNRVSKSATERGSTILGTRIITDLITRFSRTRLRSRATVSTSGSSGTADFLSEEGEL